MAPAISKPLLSDLVAQTAGQVPSIRPVGDRPDLANVDNNESGAGIPLIDLMERLKCYSDDPIKAAEARALLESLGLELERSHMVAVMGRDAQPHMAVNYYPPCPQPDLIITYGLPVHKDPHAIITQLLQDQQDGVSGIQVQRGSRWVAVNPVPADALVISIGDQLQAIGLSTSFNVRPHCYPLESFIDPPSSFRQVVATCATEARALPLRLLEAISESVRYSSSNLP